MRRSAAAATVTIAVAGIVASVALAKGSVQVKVPAPAVGSSSAYLLTVKVTGPKPGPPSVKVANVGALGQGFGAVAAGFGPKKPGHSTTYRVHLLFFMGNLSTSPASTVNLQVTPPAGDSVTVSKPKNESKDCEVVSSLPTGDHSVLSRAFLFAIAGRSNPDEFVHNVVPTLCP